VSRLRGLLGLLPSYLRTAWWGLASPHLAEKRPLLVVQALVESSQGVLLAQRQDLWGYELPGGHPRPEENCEAALVREVMEETGIEIAVEDCIGEYVRSGFRPHTARVYRGRVLGGAPAPGEEARRVVWFPRDSLTAALLPWYRAPLHDARVRRGAPVRRFQRQGFAWIGAAAAIDLRARWHEG